MRQRKFKSTLIRNYTIAGFGMIIFIILSIVFLIFRLGTYYNNMSKDDLPKLDAKDIFTKDYKSMNTVFIEKFGGWVEIVDDQYKVIFTKGIKKDDITQYDRNDLINNWESGMNQDNTIYNSIYAFKGDDGRDYLCMVKYASTDGQQFKGIFNLEIKGVDTPIYVLVIRALLESVIVLIFGTILFFIVFSRITSKSVTKPLTKIREGLNKMTNGDLDTRIDFKANLEFTEIKDSFNYMAEKIQTSERERKEVEESKKRMIMDISHDLKTPITSIVGYSKALCEGIVEDEESKKKYLNYIYDKSMRMTNLIDDLFRFSKMDGSEYKLNKGDYDLVEFLRSIIASHYGEIEAKEIELEIDLPHREILYNFDKTELDRAITNIITNMIKYNPKGTEAFVRLEKKDSIIIRIGDKGIGMSKALKERVFEAFVRGESSRKTDGGTGLGLAIAKKTIELHGGKIELETEENIGSIFTIELPKTRGYL